MQNRENERIHQALLKLDAKVDTLTDEMTAVKSVLNFIRFLLPLIVSIVGIVVVILLKVLK